MKFSPVLIPGTPEGGKEKISDLVETIVLAEQLGYDGVWLTEHHSSQYGRPFPSMVLANAAARTSRIRLGIAVVVLPWHHPLEVAEELAMLDHLSDGRLEAGFGRGLFPKETDAFGVDMNFARERFEESLGFILEAWTNKTASLDGRFWKIPEIELLPKPVQQPRPPVWIAATSTKTMAMIADHGMNGLLGPYLTPIEDIKADFLDGWHSVLAERRLAPGQLRAGHNQHVYVAETDQQAIEECEEHLKWYLRTLATQVPDSIQVNGVEQYADYGGFKEYIAQLDGDFLFKERTLVGSPDTIKEKLRYLRDEGQLDMFIPFMNFGTLPLDKVKRSMTLFAQEVMPEFRDDGASGSS